MAFTEDPVIVLQIKVDRLEYRLEQLEKKAINACKEALEQQAKQLSDDEILELADGQLDCVDEEYIKRFARAIEAKIRGK